MDIELIMDTIETTIKSFLPSYIEEMNIKKGDSLIADFVTESYLKYRLPGGGIMPNFAIFFLQYLIGPFDVTSLNQATAINYNIAIDTVVNVSAEQNSADERRLIRYQTIMRKIIENEVMSLMESNMQIKESDLSFGKSGNGNMFGISQFVLSVTI